MIIFIVIKEDKNLLLMFCLVFENLGKLQVLQERESFVTDKKPSRLVHRRVPKRKLGSITFFTSLKLKTTEVFAFLIMFKTALQRIKQSFKKILLASVRCSGVNYLFLNPESEVVGQLVGCRIYYSVDAA